MATPRSKMTAIDVETHNISVGDDRDDSLFDYDVGDVFRDVDTSMDSPTVQKSTAETNRNGSVVGLGIDEEIKVTRKRVPVPRLDESRLLSPAGIPKLRRIVKERLKFRGKGHEYSDVAQLLNSYQLWLDDLYPRAKFADGLVIIERLGHTKRMQTMRREWIDAGKPRKSLKSLGEGVEKVEGQEKLGEHHTWETKLEGRARPPIGLVEDDDELYMATPKTSQEDGKRKGDGEKERFSPEHLTSTYPTSGPKNDSPAREVDFNDDEEALLALENVM